MKKYVELKLQEAAKDRSQNDSETKIGLDLSKKKQGWGRSSSTVKVRRSKTNNNYC